MEDNSSVETPVESGRPRRNGLQNGIILLTLIMLIGVVVGYGWYTYSRSTQSVEAPILIEADADKQQSELLSFTELRPRGVFDRELLLDSPEMHALQLDNEWQSVECISHIAQNNKGQLLTDDQRGFVSEIGTLADLKRLMRETRADYIAGRKVMDIDVLSSALQKLEAQDLLPDPTGCVESERVGNCQPRPATYTVQYNQLCRDEQHYYVFYTLLDGTSSEFGLQEGDPAVGAIEMEWSNMQLAVLPIAGGDLSRYDLEKINNTIVVEMSNENLEQKINGEGLWNSCTHTFGKLGGKLYFACKGYGEGTSGQTLFRLDTDSFLLTKVAMCQSYVDYSTESNEKRYGCWDSNKRQYLNFKY